uniref:Topoisomerase 6 subunit A/Spo11 TOPRIM domain-containing protein n=1 Tax=Podarcis muralis TaxID=64176 RepID=A0A670I0D2_PODMU
MRSVFFTFQSMSFEAHRLTVPAIRWLGLLPSDFDRLSIPKTALIPLTKHDQSKLDSLNTRPYIAYQSAWKKEVCTFFYYLLFFELLELIFPLTLHRKNMLP